MCSHKFFPKRQKLLGKIAENFEGKLVEARQKVVNYSQLSKLIVTRWTVRATCFQKSIDNYTLLLKLWDECLIETHILVES